MDTLVAAGIRFKGGPRAYFQSGARMRTEWNAENEKSEIPNV